MPRRLLRERRGVTAVEFAIIAPVLLLFIFGIIETGRMMWTWQALQEAAYATARCVAIGDTRCATDEQVRQYVIDRLAGSRIGLATSDVSIASTATCNGLSGMSRVALTLPYEAPLGGLFPGFPSELTVSGCMPAQGG
ncbi:hypothetical protein GCM10011494_29060 [Novosphingobium endophyticum]|uniref:TadE-like domain-containing protein n=1 Tax=Novosphingobium endophyticum TaxID=1955250 RepID=A0A916X6F5_9SPHN|nr:TadE/TadG family type IV pilus assembly protein [Novosphingobium endophyticum]GGC08564.1 hypothetical protein GCM10011494_29060 [Novosphingobium endophyticum]